VENGPYRKKGQYDQRQRPDTDGSSRNSNRDVTHRRPNQYPEYRI
jgi:hypothetical protein